MKARKGELAASGNSRSRRFVEKEDGWYFNTRENIAVGPYPTEFDAEVCASLLIARLAQLEAQADMNSAIQAFLSDPNNGPRRPTHVAPTMCAWNELVAERQQISRSSKGQRPGRAGFWARARGALS